MSDALQVLSGHRQQDLPTPQRPPFIQAISALISRGPGQNLRECQLGVCNRPAKVEPSKPKITIPRIIHIRTKAHTRSHGRRRTMARIHHQCCFSTTRQATLSWDLRFDEFPDRYYHGGDELYWLKGVPGVWHEQCLRIDTSDNSAS